MPPLPFLAEIYGPKLAADPLVIAFVAGAAFAFGAVIGSFLNVCIARLPLMSLAAQYRQGDEELRRELAMSLHEDSKEGRRIIKEMVKEDVNLWRPPSRCPECRNPIAWYDNVPIASWLVLRARCRHCSERISFLYPLVEAGSGLALAYFVLRFGLPVGVINFILFAALVVITGVDLAIFEIPDEIVLPGIPLGFLATLVLPTTFTEALIGVLLGAGMPYLVGKGYLLLMKREGMGFGDVKMLAMLGAFFGWKGVIAVLLAASLIGSFVGIALIIFAKREARALIPFGPFLALGAMIHMLWGQKLFELYLRIAT